MENKRHFQTFEGFLNEKKPKGAPDWHDSDAPDANGRFRDLSIKDLAKWLIDTRKGDVKKISGSLTQQYVFNRNDDPEYAEKMQKTRKEVYKQLDRQDLIDAMEESVEVNEAMKMLMRPLMVKIMSVFGFKSDPNMRAELEQAIKTAIEPILRKNNIILEEEERDTLAELNEMTMGQLERIEDYAEMIAERMEAGQQLESWMFSQITVALENLNAVHEGMDGSDGVKEAIGINKYSPQTYAERVVNGEISFEEAMEDSKLPFTLLMKLVKKIDKAFKLSFEEVNSEDFSMEDHIAEMSNRINEKAKGDRGPLDNPDIEVALKKKAKESGIDLGLLRIVMRRGMDAWNSGHREGMGQEQWGYARVNAFIDKGEGTWGGADKDVAAEVKK